MTMEMNCRGETPLLLSLNFEGPLCAPMRVAEQESWRVDYWKDHEMRAKYFNVVARKLKDPTQWHQGGSGCYVRYLFRGGEKSR